MSNYQLRMRSDQISGPVVLLRLFVTPVFVLCTPWTQPGLDFFSVWSLKPILCVLITTLSMLKPTVVCSSVSACSGLPWAMDRPMGCHQGWLSLPPRLISFLWSGYRDGQVQIRGVPENSVLAIIHWCQTHINILIALSWQMTYIEVFLVFIVLLLHLFYFIYYFFIYTLILYLLLMLIKSDYYYW